MKQPLAILALALLSAGAALSGEPAALAVQPPAGFGVQPRGSLEPAVYSEASGESLNTVHREQLERLCQSKKALGATTRQPLFEAGFDRPNRSERVQFATASRSVAFVTRQVYACDPMPADRDVCGCTYRVHTYRSVYLDTQAGGKRLVLSADLSRGTGTRYAGTGGAPARAPQQVAAAVDTLLPEVVGQAEIAGIPCVLRRRSFGAARIERCIVEDPERKLAPPLRNQALSYAESDGRGRRSYWSQTTRVVPNAQVDAGVFDAPAGVTYKASTARPAEPGR